VRSLCAAQAPVISDCIENQTDKHTVKKSTENMINNLAYKKATFIIK
jgi:hypothetical protein